jgi:hypothetical protein
MAVAPLIKITTCNNCRVMNSCIFSGLDEKDLPQATQRVLQIPHTKGGTIFHHGTPVFGCYILYRGEQSWLSARRMVKKCFSNSVALAISSMECFYAV